jgi:hypothetical protein
MVLRTPPSWQQNASHPAENDRLTTQGLWRTTGVLSSTDLITSANGTPNMSVNVSLGWAAIVGNFTPNMGTYVGYNDGIQNVTVTPANGSNPRIDKLCMTVLDSFYTGSLSQVAFNLVAGTAAPSPTAPATPLNSIALANIAVGTGVTTILAGNITDLRTVSASAITVDLQFNAQTGTTYTLVAADKNKLVTSSNGASVVFTIPTGVFAAGEQINVQSIGVGLTTISGAAVTITSTGTGTLGNTPILRARFSAATIICTAAGVFTVIGDIA